MAGVVFVFEALPVLCGYLMSTELVRVCPQAILLKFAKATMTTVTLSRDWRMRLFLRIPSTPRPQY